MYALQNIDEAAMDPFGDEKLVHVQHCNILCQALGQIQTGVHLQHLHGVLVKRQPTDGLHSINPITTLRAYRELSYQQFQLILGRCRN